MNFEQLLTEIIIEQHEEFLHIMQEEIQEKPKKGNYNGIEDFTWIEYNPKTGEELHHRKRCGS
jgi:hypothetical protein